MTVGENSSEEKKEFCRSSGSGGCKGLIQLSRHFFLSNAIEFRTQLPSITVCCEWSGKRMGRRDTSSTA